MSLLTFRLHRVRQWELGIVYVNGMKSNLNVYVNGQSNPQSCTSMGVFVYVNGVIAYMNGSLWCTSMGVSVYSETQHVRANCVKKNFVSTRLALYSPPNPANSYHEKQYPYRKGREFLHFQCPLLPHCEGAEGDFVSHCPDRPSQSDPAA